MRVVLFLACLLGSVACDEESFDPPSPYDLSKIPYDLAVPDLAGADLTNRADSN